MRLQYDEPGHTIAGKYQLVEVAGNGGMALVWRALDLAGGGADPASARKEGRRAVRTVAVKRLLPELENSSAHVSMFEEEGRVGLKLRHPHIVDTVDFGRDADGRHYLVMEWIDGLDLRRILTHYRNNDRSLGWPVVAHLGRKLLSALQAAHEYVEPGGRAVPIYHRDVSPQNVMVADGGAIKLSDFGLARAMDRGSMTNPNIIKGKLSYMAPEQVIGRPATAQTDIFSVGVILWEALVGRKLFTGESDMDLVMAVRNAVVPSLRELRPDTPEPLARAIERALARDPRKRFASADEMGRAVEAALDFRNQRVAPTTVGRIVDEVKKARAAQRDQHEQLVVFEAGPPSPEEAGGDPIPMGESWPEVVAEPGPSAWPAGADAGDGSMGDGSMGDASLYDGSMTVEASEMDAFDERATQPGTLASEEVRRWQRAADAGGDDEHTVAEALGGLEPATLGGLDLPTLGELDPPTLGELDPPTLGELDPPTLGELDPPTLGGTDPPTLGGTGFPTIAGIVEWPAGRGKAPAAATPDPDVTPGPRRPRRR